MELGGRVYAAGCTAVLLLAVIAPLTAVAHGGDQVADQEAGEYRVHAFALMLDATIQVDYTFTVTDRNAGLLVPGLTVSVAAQAPGQPAVMVPATGGPDLYEAMFSGPAGEWDIHLILTGSLGTSTLDHKLRVKPPATPAVSGGRSSQPPPPASSRPGLGAADLLIGFAGAGVAFVTVIGIARFIAGRNRATKPEESSDL